MIMNNLLTIPKKIVRPNWVNNLCEFYGTKKISTVYCDLEAISIDWGYRKLSWVQKYRYKKMFNKCKKIYAKNLSQTSILGLDYEYYQLIQIATHFYILRLELYDEKYVIYDSTKDLFYECNSEWEKL